MADHTSKPAVLIIVENLPVPLDRRVWQEASALRDAGYTVVIISPKMRGYTAAEEVVDGIVIYRHWISEEARGFPGFFREYTSALWGEFFLIWKAWRRHRFKAIHLCNPPDLLFLVALPFKLLGVRLIYDVHDLWPEMYEAKFGRRGFIYWGVRLAQRLTYLVADVVVVTNESALKVSLTRGKKPRDRIFIVRTSPKIPRLDRAANPSLKKGRSLLIGYIGVMGNADGVSYLIDAAERLVRKIGREDVQFLLMGTGPEYASLVAQRNQLGLADYVDMPGQVSDEFLFTALQTMDLGVSCDPINSYNSHSSMNKVLEYMIFGKPQVMFDLKEGRASAGEAALYVPENSAAALAEAMGRLLNDPVQRDSMGAFGKERAHRELKWDHSVVNLLAAYDRALAGSLVDPTQAGNCPALQSEAVAKRDVVTVLGTPLAVTDYERLSDHCRVLAAQPFPTAIEFANTQIVTMRRHEPGFREMTDHCFDHFVPDGMPLVWCMNRLGAGLEDRVYGPAFLRQFVARSPKPLRHFFLGGTERSSRRLLAQIQAWNPAVEISGTYHGVCRADGSLADETVIEQINRQAPDFIWVGLGTPKQQAFIDRYKKRIRRGVILSVGFAFDVNAGTKRDAPLWMQRRGLTWLFRLATEPRRLGPRYIRYNTLFLGYIIREGIDGRRGL